MDTPEETFSGQGLAEQPPVGAPAPQQQEGGERHTWRIVALVVLLLVIAGGAFGYVTFFDDLSPEEVLRRSAMNSLEVESFHNKTDVDVIVDIPSPFGMMGSDAEFMEGNDVDETVSVPLGVTASFEGSYARNGDFDGGTNFSISVDGDRQFSFDGNFVFCEREDILLL